MNFLYNFRFLYAPDDSGALQTQKLLRAAQLDHSTLRVLRTSFLLLNGCVYTLIYIFCPFFQLSSHWNSP